MAGKFANLKSRGGQVMDEECYACATQRYACDCDESEDVEEKD